MVHNLVETADCLSGGGDPNAAGEQDGSLHLRKGGWAIVGFAGDVRRTVQVDDRGAGGDDNRIVRKGGGKGKGGGGSLIGVHICTALLPCVLLGLASGGVLAMVCLLLLLASLLLLCQTFAKSHCNGDLL